MGPKNPLARRPKPKTESMGDVIEAVAAPVGGLTSHLMESVYNSLKPTVILSTFTTAIHNHCVKQLPSFLAFMWDRAVCRPLEDYVPELLCPTNASNKYNSMDNISKQPRMKARTDDDENVEISNKTTQTEIKGLDLFTVLGR